MLGMRRWRELVSDRKKNGRTLFDRPEPTLGCIANGRRRRRRRRRRGGGGEEEEEKKKKKKEEEEEEEVGVYNRQDPRRWSYSRIVHKMSVIRIDGLGDILLKWVSLYWAGRPNLCGMCVGWHVFSWFGCPCWDASVCRTSSFSVLHDLSLHVFNYINIFE